MTEWIAFAFRANQIDRAAEETQLEVGRGFSGAGLNHRLSHHATRPEAEAAARDMLDRLTGWQSVDSVAGVLRQSPCRRPRFRAVLLH